MENKVLQENIKQIEHYNKNLANDILMSNIEKSNLSIIQNKNGQYNLAYNSTILHSPQDAIMEAKNIVAKIEDNKNSIKIIYGIGLGYLVEELSEKIKEGKIFVYEPNIEILKFVFSIAKIDSIFKNNVYVFNKIEDLEENIKIFSNDETIITISFLNSYKNLYFDEIKKTLTKAQMAQGEIIAEKNTLFKKAPSAFLQTITNMRNIVKNPDIMQLKDIYKDKTAIILCAGPSLKENIEVIKNNQDKFVIFALNPTIELLTKKNIKPDFIVDIESFNTTKQFSSINTEEHYFIMESFCNHEISKMKTKKTFNYISENNFFNYWVRDCLNLKENLKTLGTVSYTALMSAFIMGFNKIIITGQDLAYKDGFCYASKSEKNNLICRYDEQEKKYKIFANNYENFINSFLFKESNLQKATKCAEERLKFLNKNIITVKSQDGKFLPSQTGYALFIKYFEDSAKEFKKINPNIKLINSSTGGAQIDGYENIDLKEIIKELNPIKKIDLTNYSPNIDKKYILKKLEALSNKMSEFKSILQELNTISNKLLKELKAKNILTKNGEKHLLKLLGLISDIVKLKSKQDIGYYVSINFYDIENIFYPNFYLNIEKTKKILELVIDKIEPFDLEIYIILKRLDYCKSVILQ